MSDECGEPECIANAGDQNYAVEPQMPEGISQLREPKEGESLPFHVLEFPSMGITWPIPLEVAYGIDEMIRNGMQLANVTAVQSAFERVSGIHGLVHPEGQDAFCIECGKKSGYPCPTLKAVLGSS